MNCTLIDTAIKWKASEKKSAPLKKESPLLKICSVNLAEFTEKFRFCQIY